MRTTHREPTASSSPFRLIDPDQLRNELQRAIASSDAPSMQSIYEIYLGATSDTLSRVALMQFNATDVRLLRERFVSAQASFIRIGFKGRLIRERFFVELLVDLRDGRGLYTDA